MPESGLGKQFYVSNLPVARQIRAAPVSRAAQPSAAFSFRDPRARLRLAANRKNDATPPSPWYHQFAIAVVMAGENPCPGFSDSSR